MNRARRRYERYETVEEVRAPLGTCAERPDGQKPEAGEGAGAGLGGVTGNPFARSERKRHGKTCERNYEKSGFMSGHESQPGKGASPGLRSKAGPRGPVQLVRVGVPPSFAATAALAWPSPGPNLVVELDRLLW